MDNQKLSGVYLAMRPPIDRSSLTISSQGIINQVQSSDTIQRDNFCEYIDSELGRCANCEHTHSD